MNKKAFTLIELLVVIGIVGILSGLVVVQMNGATNAANDAKKKANLDTIRKATIMLGVSNKGAYPVESGCTVGSCSVLDPVLKEYLPNTIPGTYTYQSDGTNFTLASTLSSGYAYQYDSSSQSYSTNSPINGACGTSNNQNLSSIPSTNLCTTGTATSVTGSGPWTWNCSGIYGGTSASCQTGNVPLDGSCGSSNGLSFYTTPSTNLCSAGTPSSVSGSGPWTWSCNGSYSGLSPVCAANTIIDGACGASNGSNASSAPSTNLCVAGNATSVTGTGPWSWTCTGIRGGTTATCQTGGVPINGACGSSNNANLSSAPSTNLCTTGTATSVTGTGPWSWSCAGLNTGSTATCSANKIINGACGSANKTYLYSDSSYGSDTFCTLGTTTPTTPAFPTNGGTTNWTCVGLNSGTAASCTASRNSTPVNGACGSSNGGNFSSAPSTNLCTAGTATSVTGSGPWSWSCAGLYSGSTASCSANLMVNGSCGTKNGKYASTAPSGTQACATGTITGMTGSYSWSCAGQNGGSSPSCATVTATYAVVQFTTVGTTSWTVPAGVTSVDYLVVAGGGGGGLGGGGGGGVLQGTGFAVSGSISVTVGSGGAGYQSGGGNGGNSVFSTITAIGGGCGGAWSSLGNGINGGSGGGGGAWNSGSTSTGGSGTSGQGYAGGLGQLSSQSGGQNPGAGGGGAGGVGGSVSSNTVAGNGGLGITSNITGTATQYAGGGGGTTNGSGTAGTASYGGAAGVIWAHGAAGTPNTGGGGAGGIDCYGGSGGSGIVIIKYINNY